VNIPKLIYEIRENEDENMSHMNNDEKKHSDILNPNNTEEYIEATPFNEFPQDETNHNAFVHSTVVYDEHAQHSQTISDINYSGPIYNQNNYMPSSDKFQYNSQPYAPHVPPIHNEPTYNHITYHEQPYNAITYGESHNSAEEMYSPSIGVNQPYPKESLTGNGRNSNSRDKNSKGLVGFLRAMALVLVCAFFSGAVAHLVIDYRLDREDFASPNVVHQVTVGATAPERRQDDSITAPVAATTDIMPAEDIFDMARSQVVVINAEIPSMFGLNGATTPVSGSGFIISDDGFILTNYHVIELAHVNDIPINVILNDGTSYVAEVVGFETSNDVAVIKIDAVGLNPVHIGNSDNIRVGQTIYAIGNPFGDLVYTMTDGIISALDRVVSVEGMSINTFQFSAAVNQGNSGGPIFNTSGEVLGIVTAKIVRGNVEGIGFAIPINDAIDVAIELIERGYLSGRPFLGITGQTVSPANAASFDWVEGVLIRGVTPGSAADNAGIEAGDIITALDDEIIVSMEILRFALRDHRAGETTSITVWREGAFLDLTITFDEDTHAGRPEPRPPIEIETPDPFEDEDTP